MPWPARKLLLAPEEFGARAFAGADLLLQMIGKAAGELEHRFMRRFVADQRGIAFPAYLDAREEIGLGARQPVEPRRLELRFLAEDRFVGREGDRVPRRLAAPTRPVSNVWMPLGEGLPPSSLLRATSTTVSVRAR
jgi:hypothetical protein